MKNYGLSTVGEFLGDFLVYRNLAPMDPRLTGLDDMRADVGLMDGVIPRKSQPEYARVIVKLLQQARHLDAPGARIERLIFIGDTPMNDGTAFENICTAGNWPGLAFIGADKPEPAKVQQASTKSGYPLIVANRWEALTDFKDDCLERGLAIDESTAVVVDLDKTALGARGRNDRVIDQARVQAVENTVSGLLGEDFDPGAFRRSYDTLNQIEYHLFTADNQDYLAYICLILGGGLFQLEQILAEVNAGKLASFVDFIRRVEARQDELPLGLGNIHNQIYAAVQAGDPTPFKVFRREEYQVTVARMGKSDAVGSLEQLLQEEIVITQEVRALALEWREGGALLFGLSDKPDEASIPTDDLARQGFQAIHRTATHVVGND